METTTLLAATLIALGTLLPAAATWLQRTNRATRRENKQLKVERARRDEHVMATRAQILRHNERYHLDDPEACLPLPPLPEHMTQEDDPDE